MGSPLAPLLAKVSFLWYILTTCNHKHGSIALSVNVFENIHQKLKSRNGFEI